MSFGGWGSNNSNNTGFGSFGSTSGGFGSNSGGFGSFGSNNNNNNNNNNSGFGSNNNNNNNNFQLNENCVSFIPNNNSDHNANKDSMVDLQYLPNDTITGLRCSPTNNTFAVSSWDGNIYIYQYDTNSGAVRGISKQNHDNNRGVLCLTYDNSGNNIFSGGTDNNIKMYQMNNNNNNKFANLGKHNASVSCLQWYPKRNCLVSGSWDGYVKIWDLRSGGQCSIIINTNYKIYCMALQNDRLMVGVNNTEQSVQIYDLNRIPNNANSNNAELAKKTALNHQIKCIDMMPRGNGFAVSGIEGRCAIEYWNPTKKVGNFSFKCHRHARDKQTYNGYTNHDVYAVNSIRFHKFGGFATCGDDGAINTWDEINRTRLKQFNRLPLPVVDVDFTYDGNIMTYATSYTWAYGLQQYNKEAQRPRIYLHRVQRWEVDPNTPNPNNKNN